MTKTETLSRHKSESEASRHSASKRKQTWFRCGAILLALCPFILLEAGLRLFDVGKPTRYEDPFVGFSRIHPLFEIDSGAGVYRTAASRRMHFGHQEFSVKKKPNGFRAFCLGGSTVHGHPYQADTAFPKWLQIELRGCDPSRDFQIINCGGVSYASYRLVPVLEEVLHYEPDLIIVATGHNEFLEDRTYHSMKSRSIVREWIEDRVYSLRTITVARQIRDALQTTRDKQGGKSVLADEVEARLDRQSGYASYHYDPEWRQGVMAHFAQSVRAMVRLCSEARVPIVLVNMGCNLRDCPPFKSELAPELRPEQENQWQAAIDAATAAEATDPERALDLYRQAEGIDNHFALLDFRIGRCLDRMGRLDEARLYYNQAKEKDVCPLRILDAAEAAIFATAREFGVPLVDAKRLFEDASPERIPGFNWYMDNVHPSVGGHQQIGLAIAAELRRAGIVLTDRTWSDRKRRLACRRHLDRLEPSYWANGEVRVGWLESWSRRQKLLQETLPQDVRGHLDHGRRYLDYGEIDSAWSHYRQALQSDPATAAQVVEHARALIAQGRPQLALVLLDRLRAAEASKEMLGLVNLATLVAAVETEDWERAAGIRESDPEALARLARTTGLWASLASESLQCLENQTVRPK